MPLASRTKVYSLQMTKAQAGTVGTEMNIVLRDPGLSLESAEAYNIVFRAIFGEDHESMERRRAQVPSSVQP